MSPSPKAAPKHKAVKTGPLVRSALPARAALIPTSTKGRRRSPAARRSLLDGAALIRLQSAALASVAEAVVITDHLGIIIWVNPAFTSLAGYTLAESIGKSPRDLIKSGTLERKIYQELWETILAGEVWRGQLVHQKKDGSHYAEEQTIAPIRNKAGKVTHVIAIKRNITDANLQEEKLVASELRYRRLFESAKDGILILEADSGVVIDVNPFLIELLGLPFEEFIGKQLWELGFFTDIASNQESFAELQRCGYIRFDDKPLKTAGGQQIDVEFVSNVYLTGGNKVIQCNIRDITKRKTAEAGYDRLISILESTTDLVGVSAPDGHMLYLNRSGRKLLCIGDKEDITRTLTADYHADAGSDPVVAEGLRVAVEDGAWSGETLLLSRSGQEIAVSQVILAHKTAAGCLDFVSTIARDITAQKQSEIMVRRLAAIVDSSADAIISNDLGGKITTWNHGAEQIFGYSAAEIVGQSIMLLMPPERKEKESRLIQTIRQVESTERYETIRQTKSGGMIHVSVTASPIKDGAGKIVGMSKVARDISGRLALEDQYRQAQKMDAVGTLAGGIAHDFNNILGAIRGYTELGQMCLKDNPEVRNYLDGTLQAAKRATALVRQILNFSRQQPQSRISIQLQTVIAECASLLRASIPATIEFELEIAEDAPAVLADPNQIHQVIMNLGTNAWYAMKDRTGKLQLKLERFVAKEGDSTPQLRLAAGIYARVTVGDTGCGMTESIQKRIFEPFFTTKPLSEGTGLGLSVVHGIMQSHDGFIAVDSRLGKGTVFHLYFPAQAGAALADGTTDEALPRGHGERLLYVDDEPMLASLGQKMLGALGYEVEASTLPAAALASVRADPARFSLVLTDQHMPGLTGMDLAQQIQEIRPGMPIILISGHAPLFSAEQLAAVGVRQIVPKPASIRDLGIAVSAALAEGTELPQQTLTHLRGPVRVTPWLAETDEKTRASARIIPADHIAATGTDLLPPLFPHQEQDQRTKLFAADQMTSSAAHDINDSMSPVALYAESLLASDPTLSPRARQYLTAIQHSVKDVIHTVARMVEFYQVRKPQSMLSLVDLGEVAEASWRKLKSAKPKSKTGAELQLKFDSGLPVTIGVESEISQAFVDLFDQAIETRPEGTPVLLRSRTVEHQVSVEVERPSGGRPLVLNLPQPAARRDLPGDPAICSALRLLLVDDDENLLIVLCESLRRDGHQVATASGGAAAIQLFTAALSGPAPFEAVITDLDMPGVGGREVIRAVKKAAPTTPVFLLTGWAKRLKSDEVADLKLQGLLAKPPTQADLREALKSIEPPLPEATARLLVVEDERQLLTAICELLRMRGYRVTGVSSGALALEALTTGDIDVVLTDLLMPDLGGVELVQTVVRQYPTVVTIVMTAYGTIAGAIEAMQAGAIDYVLKPFELGTLIPILNHALTVRRLRQQKEALERTLRDHATELEHVNRELESFSFSVSHDLRSPLRAMKGYAETLQEDYAVALPAAGHQILVKLLTNADRMEGLITALLDLSKVARQPLVRSRVNVAALAREVGAELAADSPQWKGNLTITELPDCDADPDLLRQILANLISNAIKFTRDRANPRVEVGFLSQAGGPVYFVRDNGVGFEQAQAERAFVAFERLHSPAQFGGSGVGLSIVQRIVARDGGRVWAESQRDQGATFYFTLCS